jgi:lauroyl/myristoyl acyltransferase
MPEAATPPASLRIGLRVATGTIRAMGRMRYPLAQGIGLAAYATNSERRRRTAANHRRRDPSLTPAQARRLARRSFREYACATMDFVWANGLSAEEVSYNTRLLGAERLYASRRAGRGAVLVLTHYGNWDMAALIAQCHDIELTTVMAPIGNAAITELVIWARQRNRLEVFTPERAARGLLRALARGRIIAILADIPGGGPSTAVDYCGGPVEFSTVPAWLGRRGKADVFPSICRRGGPGEAPYVAEILEHVPIGPDDDETAIMQRVATALEVAVRRDPGQWYPFAEVYAAST